MKVLKDYKGESVTETFDTIVKEGRQPQYLFFYHSSRQHIISLHTATNIDKIQQYKTFNEKN